MGQYNKVVLDNGILDYKNKDDSIFIIDEANLLFVSSEEDFDKRLIFTSRFMYHL